MKQCLHEIYTKRKKAVGAKRSRNIGDRCFWVVGGALLQRASSSSL